MPRDAAQEKMFPPAAMGQDPSGALHHDAAGLASYRWREGQHAVREQASRKAGRQVGAVTAIPLSKMAICTHAYLSVGPYGWVGSSSIRA